MTDELTHAVATYRECVAQARIAEREAETLRHQAGAADSRFGQCRADVRAAGERLLAMAESWRPPSSIRRS
jgi:hypothetical protein